MAKQNPHQTSESAADRFALSGPVFCDRCTTEVHPGSGNFWWVNIEAFADPTAPIEPEERKPEDLRREIEALLARLNNVSAQEAMDQVHRRVTVFLCQHCYRDWIENPTGTGR